jgi:hypothetical protein
MTNPCSFCQGKKIFGEGCDIDCVSAKAYRKYKHIPLKEYKGEETIGIDLAANTVIVREE